MRLTLCFLFIILNFKGFGQFEYTIDETTYKYNNRKYSPEKLKEIIVQYKHLYNFQGGDKVLSINSDRGVDEIIYSLESPEVIFYLSNKNLKLLDANLIKQEIAFFEKVYGKTSKSDFLILDETKITGKLPNLEFDKIIFESPVEKLNYDEKLLLSLYLNLKVNGKMFVKIRLRNEDGDNMNLFSLIEFIPFMKSHGFVFVEKYAYSGICEFTKLK